MTGAGLCRRPSARRALCAGVLRAVDTAGPALRPPIKRPVAKYTIPFFI